MAHTPSRLVQRRDIDDIFVLVRRATFGATGLAQKRLVEERGAYGLVHPRLFASWDPSATPLWDCVLNYLRLAVP